MPFLRRPSPRLPSPRSDVADVAVRLGAPFPGLACGGRMLVPRLSSTPATRSSRARSSAASRARGPGPPGFAPPGRPPGPCRCRAASRAALEPRRHLDEPRQLRRQHALEGLDGVAEPLVLDAELVELLRLVQRAAPSPVDVAPRVLHRPAGELRDPAVARGLRAEGEQASSSRRPRSRSPSRMRGARARPQAPLAADARPRSRPSRRAGRPFSEREQLQQHLFVAQGPRRAVHLAERRAAPRWRGSARTRVAPTSSRVRVRRSATRKSWTASPSPVVRTRGIVSPSSASTRAAWRRGTGRPSRSSRRARSRARGRHRHRCRHRCTLTRLAVVTGLKPSVRRQHPADGEPRRSRR